jgi:hypothetical protein
VIDKLACPSEPLQGIDILENSCVRSLHNHGGFESLYNYVSSVKIVRPL